MPRRSEGPPEFETDYVPPVPVYGVRNADGALAQPRTVAEGDAALRARLAASEPLHSASSERRLCAAAIDGALSYGVAAGIAEIRPVSTVALVALAVGAFYLLRVIVGTVAGGASPGRFVLGTRAVDQEAERLDLLQLAGREAYVLFLVATFPFWILTVLYFGPRYARQDITTSFSWSRAPVPQDETTGTTVSTSGEIARVRAATALRFRTALRDPDAAHAALVRSAANELPRVPAVDPGHFLAQFLRALVIAVVIVTIAGWRFSFR